VTSGLDWLAATRHFACSAGTCGSTLCALPLEVCMQPNTPADASASHQPPRIKTRFMLDIVS
jgi:hypothetical protein